MDRIIDLCKGVIGISDDRTFYGGTKKQHDVLLVNHNMVARKEHLMLNSGKCVVRTKSILLFCRWYTDKGVIQRKLRT